METNTKRKKFIIFGLIAITIIVIIYIISRFFGGNTGTENNGQKKIFDFGSVLVKKKIAKDGTPTNTNPGEIDLGNNGQNGPSDQNPGGGIGLPGSGGNLPINPGGQQLPNFTPLPDPGTFNRGPGTDTDPDTQTEVKVPDTNTKTRCADPKLSGQLRDILCEPDGDTVNKFEPKPIPFALTDEEQAELDRLSRAFARLAPYLKTEADIAREQANMEAYENTVLQNNSLAKKTDVERKSLAYKGPLEVVQPFLEPTEFNLNIQQQFSDAALGNAGGLILPGLNVASTSKSKTKIAKKIVSGFFEKGSTGGSIIGGLNIDDMLSKLGTKMTQNVIDSMINHVTEKSNEILDNALEGSDACQRNKDSASHYKNPQEVCGKSLFEKFLSIY